MTIDLADENFALLSTDVARKGVANAAGNLQFSEGVDSGEDDPAAVGAGRSQSSFIQRGLRNADFWDGPELGLDSIIDASNLLPEWSVTCTGDAVARWVEDAGFSGERSVEMLVTNTSSTLTLTQRTFVAAMTRTAVRFRLTCSVATDAISGTIDIILTGYDRDEAQTFTNTDTHTLSAATSSLDVYTGFYDYGGQDTAWLDVSIKITPGVAGTTFGVGDVALEVTREQFIGCVAVPTTEATVTATPEIIDWDDTDERDTHNFHNPSSNPSRITIPVGMDGDYVFGIIQSWAANAAGDRVATLLKNGGATGYGSSVRADTAGHITRTEASTPPLACVAGDYFEVQVEQDSGGNLNFRTESRFWCERVA